MTGGRIRVGIDYRPALWRAFGIGRYVRNLVRELVDVAPDIDLELLGFFLRGQTENVAAHEFPDPSRAHYTPFRFPARLLPAIGALGFRAQWLTGPLDAYHDTDYALTPVGSTPRVVTLYDTAFFPEHGFVSEGQSRKMTRIVRSLLRGNPEIVTISAFARDELVRGFGLDPRRVHVTPLAPDPQFSEVFAKADVDAVLQAAGLRTRYVICIGTLEPRKNVVRLVQAFARVRPQHGDLRLVLLGRPGWRHHEVDGAARAAGVADAVLRLGSVSDRDAAILVQSAACLAFPTLYEGFGLPALEGLAAGVPVVASDIAVMHEVCGDAAIYCAPTDVGSIADALLQAIAIGDDAGLRAARRARAAGFSWRRCALATAEVYRRAGS